MKTDDTLIFLDAYIDRVPSADGPPGASTDVAVLSVSGRPHVDGQTY
jgi:hypothetical protein